MDRQEWEIKLRGWSAWAPGLETQDAWMEWLQQGSHQPRNIPDIAPSAQAVPPRLRRRCSTLGRMVLEMGLLVCEQTGVSGADVNLVYCSRNGELSTLKSLLEDLWVSEPLSPTRFSNSVHHTPMGYFGLTTQNKRISRTISGGDDSFACGLLESISLLNKDPTVPVLLFYSDECIPEPFNTMLEKPAFPFAVAMLLDHDGDTAFQISYENCKGSPGHECKGQDRVFPFLEWLTNDRENHHLQTSFGGMTWKR